ncbi:hypothetical protein Tco_0570405 [Tanacetum coccineum]
MENLEFCDKHNMVAFLEKSDGSEGFHQIVDFLNSTHIKYALTQNPIIYVSLIHQFWDTASSSTSENGEMKTTATIDGRVKTITAASIRRHLKLKDSNGISTLPNTEIFKQLTLMGYVSNSDRLTFNKGHFSPKWRFFIHTTLHCLSAKKTAWDQFSSNIATAIMCLATNRTFNFSKLVFDGLGEGSTIPVESHHTPTSAPSTSQPQTLPPSMQTTHVAEEAAPMPHDSPLLRVQSLGSDEGSLTLHELSKKVENFESDLKQTKLTYGAAYTKLIKKVKKLEHKVKLSKARRRVRLVFSDDKDDLEDPSKQGRKIAHIDEDEGITLFQIGVQTQKRSNEDLMYETGVYDYPEGFSGPSVSITTAKLVTTAGEGFSTTRATPENVSTAEPDMDVTLTEALVDLLKSGKKKSPKPNAMGISFQDAKEVARRAVSTSSGEISSASKIITIAEETVSTAGTSIPLVLLSEPEQTTTKLKQRQERAGLEAAIRMQEQLNEEESQRIARDAEIAKYYEDVRLIFERVWDQNHTFVSKDSKIEKEVMKRPGFDLQQNHIKKNEKIEALVFIKKRPREDADEERDDVAMDVESLATKYPIVDWKTHTLIENFMYYQIIRADGSSNNYKIFSEMLDDFDR